MIKIGFCGTPSSGKTTVAQNFASTLRFATQKKVELVDEFARWFVANFGETTVEDQYLIAHRQIDKERSVDSNIDYLITDSPAFLSLIYAYMGMDWKSKKSVFYLNELYSLLSDQFHAYDHIFYFPLLDNTTDDGKRIHTDIKILKNIDSLIRGFLILHKINHVEIDGDLNARVQQVMHLVIEQ